MKEFIKQNLESGKILRKFVDFFHFLYLSFANHIVSKIPFYFIRTFIYKYFYLMKIGKNSHIQMGLRVYAPWKIKIGSNCSIGNNCFLDGRRSIEIGNNVDLASYVQILTLGHNLDDEWYKTVGKKVIINDHASIFTSASILPGVEVAEGSVVALASVLTKNTEPWSIYAGNPAKFIRERKVKSLKYLHNYKRYFH
ncbi:MAG TPA: acyltransferase [Chitinophagales bacterium]|nr:acyltransferase [Chitinophagales bacterium]